MLINCDINVEGHLWQRVRRGQLTFGKFEMRDGG